ncbi:DNA-binding protein [Aliivibrio fischeri]|uniref:DNA-binding protein n=2 Tax=Aliivibrio fischeri TaxID=668 RepID=A0A510UEH8_ALIFS|nr:DNA-binding protein [Aliivibrio fischeri]
MMKGKVVEWNDSKGYGFISALNGELKVFLHISTLKNKNRRPKIGDEVSFDINEEIKGRFNANNVSIVGANTIPSTIMFCFIYLVLASVALVIFNGEKMLLVLYLGMSLLTYAMYAVDKNAAKKGNWRTPENTLHLLSLLGGWPGALFAQNQFRHKSKKQPFKTILWITIFVNIGAFAWTFTSSGTMFMQNIIGNVL